MDVKLYTLGNILFLIQVYVQPSYTLHLAQSGYSSRSTFLALSGIHCLDHAAMQLLWDMFFLLKETQHFSGQLVIKLTSSFWFRGQPEW